MIPTFAAIAERLILLGKRAERGCTRLTPDQLRPGGGPISEGFFAGLAAAYPHAREDDLIAVTVELLRRRPGLADWYDAALTDRNIEIAFLNGEPLVRPIADSGRGREGEEWLDLCARIDPDALIALQFARLFRRRAGREDLLHWDIYARIHDVAVLGAPMRARLRDIHTHLSGCEPAPLLWQELAAGQISLLRLPAYGGAPGRFELDRSGRAEEMQAVRRALAHADRIIPVMTRREVGERTRLSACLWPERAGLIAHWLAVLAGGPGAEAAARRLDAYLHGKNRFLGRHLQSPRNNPGLEGFRRRFDMLRPMEGRRSPWAQRRYLQRWGDFAFSAPSIDHIEFRIAPKQSVRDYLRGLADYRWAFSHLSLHPPRPGIPPRSLPRFVVHFIRPQSDPFAPGAPADLRALWRKLDKECAALMGLLQYGSSDPGARRLSDLVVGVDVCNVERFAPIEHFAPHLKLLRAQRLSPMFERYLARKPQYFERTTLCAAHRRRNGRARPLGLTLHSGEDYFHPLIGLREIWNAVAGCEMRPGDRIGHALALGADIPGFARRYGGSVIVPRGMMLDGAIWLLRRLGTEPGVDLRVLRALEDVCGDLSRAVFGRAMSHHALKTAIDLRQFPVTLSEFRDWFPEFAQLSPRDEVADIVGGELFDAQVHARRSEMIVAPAEFNQVWMIEAMTLVQRQLVERICTMQIVIEMNPTSNRAVGEFAHMRDHPILNLKLACPELRVAVSCDDPGNFGVRLENELALCAQAMRELGRDQAEIEQVLDSLIDVTRKAAFGRISFSNNDGDWRSRVSRDERDQPHDPLAGPALRHDPFAGPD